ncbi:MAG: hypothetical protein ACK41C_12815 [Phenylobacterium sp.]|uniref:hypothetical protein n=1 Tax=Phenylobacterium sp. TaxID=1871053 RepID=UPI00391897F4
MPVTPNSIITPQTPRTGTAVLTTASTDIDDAPSASVLLTMAGENGARVTRIRAAPRATVTATNLLLYLSKDGGETQRLVDSRLMAAHTVSNTTEIPRTDFGYSDGNPLILEAGDRLYAAATVASAAGIVVAAEWADY